MTVVKELLYVVGFIVVMAGIFGWGWAIGHEKGRMFAEQKKSQEGGK